MDKHKKDCYDLFQEILNVVDLNASWEVHNRYLENLLDFYEILEESIGLDA